MDRILYFRMTGKKEYTGKYRIQVFRKTVLGKDILYLQVCGYPSVDSVLQVKDEMQKAVDRMLSYTRRQESFPVTYLVYEESFTKWLESVHYEREWRRLWHTPMYTDFYASENVHRMLDTVWEKGVPQEAWVIGYGLQMQEWLPRIAGKVRSLKFYVEFMTKGFEALLEELEENFGLVAQVQLVLPGELHRQRLRCAQPVLVLDFSGKEIISTIGVCRGSMWLDMDSVEAKRHAIEDRRLGITYISLKNLWKREMSQTLDTVGNFEYNTEVKIDRLGG